MMGALLRKDFYILLKHMKLFLLVLFIFALAAQENFDNVGIFAIFYAMMLPVSSMAYDEQSKWPQLAMMLPYSIKDLVLSKYLLGWILAAAVSLVVLLPAIGNPEIVWVVAVVLWSALSFLAITLPLVFWLGTEKGRLLLVAVVAGIFGVISAIGFISSYYGRSYIPLGSNLTFFGASIVLVVLLNLVSVLISMKLYKRRLMQG